jgi:hypothetical protein
MHTLARRRRDPAALDIAARVAQLEIQVAQIRALLEAGRGPRDPAADSALLSALAAALGQAAFSTADVLALAASHPELAAVLDGRDGRRLGARLKRLRGRTIDGYVVERVGRDGAGALWCISVASYNA